MRNFKPERSNILVATDVAARGLDISGVTHIYKFDIPQDAGVVCPPYWKDWRAGEIGIGHYICDDPGNEPFEIH
jgi:ATP-dependent RNA helicase DeaD